MRTSNVDNAPLSAPYNATPENVRQLAKSADNSIVKFDGLILGLKYDENRFPTGFDSFAEARDCITHLEQICAVLEGPYRIVDGVADRIELYQGKLGKMKRQFEPVQYSENTLRILFPERYAPVSKVMSQGSTPPISKRAS